MKQVEIEKTRTGLLTLKFNNLYIHSKYDPIKDIRDFLSNYKDKVKPKAILFGWGADYFINEILKELPAIKKLYIFPTNLSLFKETFKYFDYEPIFQDERIELLLDLRRLTDIMKQGEVKDILVISHPPSLKIASPDFAPLRDMLEEGLYKGFIEEHWEKMDGLLKGNLAANWETGRNDKAVKELFGIYKNKPCIVAGAGPSLAKDIENILAAAPFMGALTQAKACGYSNPRTLEPYFPIIITVDAAYKPLVAAGIDIDYVVSIDPLSDMPEFFKGLPAKGSLIYRPMVDPGVLEAWKGKRYMAFLTLDNPLTDEQVEKGILYSGGSVIHAAVDLAYKMGCNPITFIGADFSYSNGYSHSEGVLYRREIKTLPLYRQIKGKDGKMLWSSKNLIAYLRELERYIAEHKDVKWLNATSNGAEIRGADI
ncbi:MAG: motility associated factor glycosyltransferase family protein [Deltaproteobacteria bacterium]|nr:motility associated factor glycosyltransferase family protein [Deltaproteobacteria bacterium]